MMNRSVMERQMFKDGGAAFPDLSGDGKITQKDILMGRGVQFMEMGGPPSKMASPAVEEANSLRQRLLSRRVASEPCRKRPNRKCYWDVPGRSGRRRNGAFTHESSDGEPRNDGPKGNEPAGLNTTNS